MVFVKQAKESSLFCSRGKSVRVKELTTKLGRGELISGASFKRNLTVLIFCIGGLKVGIEAKFSIFIGGGPPFGVGGSAPPFVAGGGGAP